MSRNLELNKRQDKFEKNLPGNRAKEQRDEKYKSQRLEDHSRRPKKKKKVKKVSQN